MFKWTSLIRMACFWTVMDPPDFQNNWWLFFNIYLCSMLGQWFSISSHATLKYKSGNSSSIIGNSTGDGRHMPNLLIHIMSSIWKPAVYTSNTATSAQCHLVEVFWVVNTLLSPCSSTQKLRKWLDRYLSHCLSLVSHCSFLDLFHWIYSISVDCE